MPANEQTWRSLPKLHVVFGISAILMFLTTVWLLVADHNREWRQYQTKWYDLEAWSVSQRINETDSANFKKDVDSLRRDVLADTVQSWFVDSTAVEKLVQMVQDAKELVPLKLSTGYLTSTDNVTEQLTTAITAAGTARNELLTAAGLDPATVPPGQPLPDDNAAQKKLLEIAAGQGTTAQTAALENYRLAREKVLGQVRDLIKQVFFVEQNLVAEVKLQRANLDKARAEYDQSINENKPDDVIAKYKKTYSDLQQQLEGTELARPAPGTQPAAQVVGMLPQLQQIKTLREGLEGQLKSVTAIETASRKKLDDQLAKLEQLRKSLEERANHWQKDVVDLPIINAFGARLRPDQTWLPNLTQTFGSFGQVARFDRCTTCHMGIAKTKPGSAVEPLFPPQHSFTVEIIAPALEQDKINEMQEKFAAGDLFTEGNNFLSQQFGFTLAETGLFRPDEATISSVLPESLAAKAGLNMGDVILSVQTAETSTINLAFSYLLEDMTWGKPFKITVKRGAPQPYCAHPRLDLFVGSLSPHPIESFGCSVCHQGNGSATAFKWASHTPNLVETESEWTSEYGWFNNHHWVYPMWPARFAESGCLKCHHEVAELDSSERFPDTPAPRLVEGFNTIKDYGCFGCHEINGYDGPNRRIGPDLRNEPSYYAAAQQLLADAKFNALGPDAVQLAQTVVQHPEDDATRRRLLEMISLDAAAAAAVREGKSTTPPVLSPDAHRLEAALKDVSVPGKLRKVGPSLRFINEKVGYDFLYDWIRDPTHFRPTTKMPRFFGLWDALSGDQLEKAKLFEQAEIQGITEYLLTASQTYQPVEPTEKALPPSLERGKQLFEVRGCLACHSHVDFPSITANQGPDLSNLGAKLSLDPVKGQKWLYSWVREPHRYHVRTVMPNLYLDPYEDAQLGVIDPAADIAAYLFASQKLDPHSDAVYQPLDVPARGLAGPAATAFNDPQKFQKFRDSGYDTSIKLTALTPLEALAYEHLIGRFTKSRAAELLQNGLPATAAEQIQGDEALLIGLTAENRHQRLLQYVGKRSLNKYGCFGCHDIPGYEDAKPIGAALADWGRKDTSKLAFENISAYVHHVMEGHGHGGNSGHGNAHANDQSGGHAGDMPGPDKGALSHATGHGADAVTPADPATNNKPLSATVNPAILEQQDGPPRVVTDPFALATADPLPPLSVQAQTREFFIEKLLLNEREGFIWQKLNAPRSYDYQKTAMKPYNDKLRMPKFRFARDEAAHQRALESVVTFVLGLVAEPPAPQYIFNPPPAKRDIIAGKLLLEKYNCGGCHMIRMEQWDIAYTPEMIAPGPDFDGFPFEKPIVTPEQIAQSKKLNAAGLMTATLHGLAQRNPQTGEIQKFSLDDDSPLEPGDTTTPGYYNFDLFEPVILNGEYRQVSKIPVRVPEAAIARRGQGDNRLKVFPTLGGAFAKYLFPILVKNEKEYKLDGKEQEAWGWGPPTLFHEGRKVQTGWLHDFLLEPHPIRPAAALRMPKFNMSSAEALQFANYFAAMDGVPYPYEANPQTQETYLAAAQQAHSTRLDDALKIVNAQCIKCHLLNDYSAGGSPKALAPQLNRVHERLRPEYIQKWVANPNSILPYTGMLRVIAHGAPVPDAQFPGETPEEQSSAQLQGVLDLLLNFHKYSKSQFSIKPLVTVPPATDGAATDAKGAGANAAQPEQPGETSPAQTPPE
ncbi:MAG: hypothetical protein SFX18_13860 [Pirellulales bacterium]|nr:hypothetical protein [Pirellulales bacterium]